LNQTRGARAPIDLSEARRNAREGASGLSSNPRRFYAPALRNEAATANVQVEFKVDINGAVLNAVVVRTTQSGFDDAAITGG